MKYYTVAMISVLAGYIVLFGYLAMLTRNPIITDLITLALFFCSISVPFVATKLVDFFTGRNKHHE